MPSADAMRREIADDTDIDLAIDALYGTIWIRVLLGRGALDDRFADALVEMMVKALQVSSGPNLARFERS